MYLSKNKKSGIYYIYYRQANGKKTRASTKTTYKREALIYLSEFEKKIKRTSNKTTITIKKLMFKYLSLIEITHTKKSWKLSRKSLEHFIKAIGEDTPIGHINKSMCESFILNKYKTAKYSALLHLRHLKAIFNKAIEWEYIEKNPFNGIKLKVPQNHPIFISREELELILEKETNPMLSSIYKLAFFTGMRLSEITNLTSDQINLDLKTISVKNKVDGFTTKSKKERVIPMNKIVYDILSNIEQKCNFVFSKNLVKLNDDFVSKSFKKSVKANPTLNQKIHFHSLRHSFASNLAQRGINLYVIQKLLGHSSITTTQIYSHLRTEDLVKAINELN